MREGVKIGEKEKNLVIKIKYHNNKRTKKK